MRDRKVPDKPPAQNTPLNEGWPVLSIGPRTKLVLALVCWVLAMAGIVAQLHGVTYGYMLTITFLQLGVGLFTWSLDQQVAR